ncbi:hypothetical protein FJR05_16470 [Dolichospermum sp. UHCC 0259]|nr:hypothetical protein [Dolichospermum sp. UHCC 0259]
MLLFFVLTGGFFIGIGYYPESVHLDQIYRTKDNRKWRKEREIRISSLYFHLQALLIDSWFGLNTTFQQALTNFFRIEMQYSALIF